MNINSQNEGLNMHYQTVLTNTKLDTWIQLNRNVLLIGEHGVGKTSLIVSAFERNFGEMNKDWVILSGANLDPWTDLIGVPKVKTQGKNEFLDFIRPRNMSDDIQAIFIDEFNRTHKTVRNALMELLQFKSINGRAFPKLKIVWAAINPEKDEEAEDDDNFEYDVEKIDPAQKDRFHVIVQLPYKPSKPYFRNKFGELIGEQAIKWWDLQGKKAQQFVSPRRLDYAVEFLQAGGNVREVLPQTCNVNKFVDMINTSPTLIEFEKIKGHDIQLKQFFKDENKFQEMLPFLKKNENHPFLEFIPEEKLSQLIDSDSSIRQFVISHYITNNDKSSFKKMVEEKINAGDQSLSKEVTKLKKAFETPLQNIKYKIPANKPLPIHSDQLVNINYTKGIHDLTASRFSTFLTIYENYEKNAQCTRIKHLYDYVVASLRSFQTTTINDQQDQLPVRVRRSSMTRRQLIISVANTIINDYQAFGYKIDYHKDKKWKKIKERHKNNQWMRKHFIVDLSK